MRRKECDIGSPRASENTNEALERILPIKLPKGTCMSYICKELCISVVADHVTPLVYVCNVPFGVHGLICDC